MAIKFVNVADEIEERARRKREAERQKKFNRTEYQREYMRAVRSSVCYIYIIGVDGGPLKIGVTTDVQKRLENLAAQSPYPVRIFALWQAENKKRAEIIECTAHAKLAPYHSHYEWFNCSLEVAASAVKDAGAHVVVDLTTVPVVSEKRKPWEKMKKQILPYL